MSVRAAAKAYGVPFSCLQRRTDPNFSLLGPPTVLTTEEENTISRWVIDVSKRGFPVTQAELKDSVQAMLNTKQRITKFKNNKPGQTWMKSFLCRRKELSKRMCENICKSRALVSEKTIRDWFSEVKIATIRFYERKIIGTYFQVKSYMDSEQLSHILQDPRRIFNFDETAIYLHPKKKYVITQKGTKNVYNVSSGNDKECVTVLLGCNAFGDCPPAMILYKYLRLPRGMSETIPAGIAMQVTQSGWMNTEAFYKYMTQTFYPWLKENNVVLPIVVFLDGHGSHLSIPLSEFCRDNGIVLIALPPNATHILQPIDVGVIYPLKCIWKKVRHIWERNNVNAVFCRKHFGSLLKESLDELQKSRSIFPSAFNACGTYYKLVYDLRLSLVLLYIFYLLYRDFPIQCRCRQLLQNSRRRKNSTREFSSS